MDWSWRRIQALLPTFAKQTRYRRIPPADEQDPQQERNPSSRGTDFRRRLLLLGFASLVILLLWTMSGAHPEHDRERRVDLTTCDRQITVDRGEYGRSAALTVKADTLVPMQCTVLKF